MKDDTGRFKGNLYLLFGELLPVQDVLDIFRVDFELITVSDSTFQKNSNAVGESVQSRVCKSRKTIILECFVGD